MIQKKRHKGIKQPTVFEVNSSKQFLIHIGIIIVLTFILYGNTLKNNYSFDDIYVTNNKDVRKGISVIPELFVSLYANMWEDGKPLTFGYRPVVKSTFAIEYSVFGLNPGLSHLINLLLYIFTCIILFIVLKRLMIGYHVLFPLVITLIFLAHPAHTEIVSSLKNRDELLSFLGAFGTLYLFLKYFDKGKLYFALIGFVVFILAYLSKPTVTVFIPLYALILYFFTKPKTGRVLLFLLGLLVLAYLVNFIPRLYLPKVQRPVQFIENPLFYEGSFWIKASTGMYIILFYLKLLIYPHPLVFYYGFDTIPIVGWGNIWVILSFILHLGLFAFAIWKIREKHILSFGILFYLASIGVFANIIKLPMGIVADRFMYIPSLGFSIIIAYLFFYIFKINPKSLTISKSGTFKIFAILIMLLIPYSAKTITRNNDWKDQPTLLKNDIKYLKKSAKANLIYSGTMKGEIMRAIKRKDKDKRKLKRQIDDVVEHLDLAISIYPEYYQAYEMKGSIYITFFKKYEIAIKNFNKALSIKPNHIPSLYGLAYCYSQNGQTDLAIKNYNKTIKFDPDNIQAHKGLYKLYKEIGDIEKATYYGKKTKEITKKLKSKK